MNQSPLIIKVLQVAMPIVAPILEQELRGAARRSIRSVARRVVPDQGEPPLVESAAGEGCPYCHAVRHLWVASKFLELAEGKSGEWRQAYTALAQREVEEAPSKLRGGTFSEMGEQGERFLNDLELLEVLFISKPAEVQLLAGETDRLAQEGVILAEETNVPHRREEPAALQQQFEELKRRIAELETRGA